MASSPSQAVAEAESQLSSLVYEMSQHVQTAMENMLKMIRFNQIISLLQTPFLLKIKFCLPFKLKFCSEIDQNSSGVREEIEKCKDSALERKKGLEEEKERLQKAAYTILDMLSNRD
ncbi:hypothetical protein POUND7_011098 [Theobroma cacao]